jgi:hypothetical protein
VLKTVVCVTLESLVFSWVLAVQFGGCDVPAGHNGDVAICVSSVIICHKSKGFSTTSSCHNPV